MAGGTDPHACPFPERESFLAESGRVVDIGLPVPDVAQQGEGAVAAVAAGLEQPEAHRLAELGGEDRGLRIASYLGAGDHVVPVVIIGAFERRLGSVLHALPERLGAVVDRLLARV